MNVLATAAEECVQEVVARVGPAVVRVGRRGAGLVVDSGFVATSAHHVKSGTVPVAFGDGAIAHAAVAGSDTDGDVAVLAVDTGSIEPPEWSPAPVALGRLTVALAQSSSGGLRATIGSVSATEQAFRGPAGRLITNGFEHTAAMARGSSGGPILDGNGRLLGLNTHRLADGFYLAVPADAELRDRLSALASGDARTRPRLGVGVAPASTARRLRASVGLPPRDGALIRTVDEDSPAAAAGLRTGDLIVSAGGGAVADAEDLYRALDALGRQGSAELAIDIVRGIDEVSMSVVFVPPNEGGE